MILNKHHKQAIVNAVIADIPRVHSKDLYERAQKIIDQDILDTAPPEVVAIYRKPELSRFLHVASTNLGYAARRVCSNCLPYVRHIPQHTLSDDSVAKLGELVDQALEELKCIKAAEVALTASLAGIKTRKQFVSAYPELEKYAPEAQVKTENLPAVANVMTTLMRMGWPKDRSEPACA